MYIHVDVDMYYVSYLFVCIILFVFIAQPWCDYSQISTSSGCLFF